MSIQEFLRTCFYPRLEKGEENREERTLGGYRSLIPQPFRRDFLNKEYEGTDIWDKSPRHPLLCSNGHYSWFEESDKTPSSFTIVTPNTLTTLRNKIERGDYISGAHFKHHINELDECNCGNGRDVGEKIRAEQRKAALANRVLGTPVLQNFDGKYELKYFVKNGKDKLAQGVYEVGEVDGKNKVSPVDLINKVSLWMISRDAGSIPRNCAGYLCMEDETPNNNLFIPDTGRIILIIPSSSKEDYIKKLTRLKSDMGEGVKMGPGSGETLSSLVGYSQGVIEWNDSESQQKVKSFIESITKFKMHQLRSTRPLTLEILDSNYEPITPVSSDRKNEYCLKRKENYYMKIRRMRSAPLEGFRMLLGPSIDVPYSYPAGIEGTSLGVDEVTGGTVLKIFVRKSRLQNGLWTKVAVNEFTEGAWIEVFDHGSSVEQSGMRIKIVSEDSF